MQSILFEVFYRLAKGVTKKALEKIFAPHFTSLVQLFRKLSPTNFFEDCRKFLNELNSKIPEEKRRVRSFALLELKINGKKAEMSPTWCDLTSSDITIWYKEGESKGEDKETKGKQVQVPTVPSFVCIPLDTIDSFSLSINRAIFSLSASFIPPEELVPLFQSKEGSSGPSLTLQFHEKDIAYVLNLLDLPNSSPVEIAPVKEMEGKNGEEKEKNSKRKVGKEEEENKSKRVKSSLAIMRQSDLKREEDIQDLKQVEDDDTAQVELPELKKDPKQVNFANLKASLPSHGSMQNHDKFEARSPFFSHENSFHRNSELISPSRSILRSIEGKNEDEFEWKGLDWEQLSRIQGKEKDKEPLFKQVSFMQENTQEKKREKSLVEEGMDLGDSQIASALNSLHQVLSSKLEQKKEEIEQLTNRLLSTTQKDFEDLKRRQEAEREKTINTEKRKWESITGSIEASNKKVRSMFESLQRQVEEHHSLLHSCSLVFEEHRQTLSSSLHSMQAKHSNERKAVLERSEQLLHSTKKQIEKIISVKTFPLSFVHPFFLYSMNTNSSSLSNTSNFFYFGN